jgi:mannitol-1-phosphate/altronate dehydrogenase
MTVFEVSAGNGTGRFEMAAEKPLTKTEKKLKAQEMLMTGIGNVLGYWTESGFADEMTEAEQVEFQQALQQQADRVAKMFGFDKAWSN